MQSLRARFQLPLGAIVHPLAGPQDDVPVIQLGPAGIVRCKRCRTYINPFMMWQDGGRCGAGPVLPIPLARLRPYAMFSAGWITSSPCSSASQTPIC